VDARALARLHALGRVAMGAALTLAPGRTARGWVGSAADRPGARVIASAMGARDVAIGLGAARALAEGFGARPWLRAGVLADATDLVATLRARSDLRPAAVVGVGALAAGSTMLGLYLERAVD
jgi:hypothetical protein